MRFSTLLFGATVLALPLDSERLAYSKLVSLVGGNRGSHLDRREVPSHDSNLSMVMFKEDVLTEQKLNHVKALLSTNSTIQQLYDVGKLDNGSGVVGYMGSFSHKAVNLISQCPTVSVLQHDEVIIGGAREIPEPQEVRKRYSTPSETPWYLSRISHLENSPDSAYISPHPAQVPTNIYILDSGIRTTHSHFSGRAVWGANFYNSIDEDEHGHGTGVAGVAASVSKDAKIIGVKVLGKDNTGSLTGVIAGLEWALNHASESPVKSIINMSFGSSVSSVYEPLIARAVRMGIPLVFSAGNTDQDACSLSPAESANRYNGVYSVGSTDENDVQSHFSGWGECVTLLAPGENIYAPSSKSDNSYVFWEGTSMSSPQVAGLASYWLSVLPLDLPSLDWTLTQNRGRVHVKNGTPNILAWNMFQLI
ncbi:Alkaline extracellular protease [Yarrowia sp. C11]|nr:Alkaline extracellular protease [Yarrowia sp. C11]